MYALTTGTSTHMTSFLPMACVNARGLIATSPNPASTNIWACTCNSHIHEIHTRANTQVSVVKITLPPPHISKRSKSQNSVCFL